jgi:hypothetical protein
VAHVPCVILALESRGSWREADVASARLAPFHSLFLTLRYLMPKRGQKGTSKTRVGFFRERGIWTPAVNLDLGPSRGHGTERLDRMEFLNWIGMIGAGAGAVKLRITATMWCDGSVFHVCLSWLN